MGECSAVIGGIFSGYFRGVRVGESPIILLKPLMPSCSRVGGRRAGGHVGGGGQGAGAGGGVAGEAGGLRVGDEPGGGGQGLGGLDMGVGRGVVKVLRSVRG